MFYLYLCFYFRKHREDLFRHKQLSYAVLPEEQYPQIKKSWLAACVFSLLALAALESLNKPQSQSYRQKQSKQSQPKTNKNITNTLANSEVEG